MILVLNIVPLYMYLGNLPLEGEIGAFLFPFFFLMEKTLLNSVKFYSPYSW